MNRFARTVLALASLAPMLAAAPAAADDGRRHVMTPTQKIDLVRDLPNDETFERDGEYFDLGYIYPIHTVNGASVAAAGGEAGFVLYHDDRYAILDATDIQTLSMALGEDPTEGYNPPVASSSAQPFSAGASRPDWAGSAPARGSGKLGVAGFFLIVLASAAIYWVRRTLRRAVVREMQGGWESHPPAKDRDPFEARLAARLAELEQGTIVPEPAGYQPPTPAAARGFGRKGA